MVLIGVGSVSSPEHGSNYLELGGNDENGDKNLVVLCQPWGKCSHIYESNDLIK